jgi:hypothetical protein
LPKWQFPIVVVLLSKSSIQASWVQTELALAHQLGVRILPVLVGIGKSDLPPSVQFKDSRIPDEISSEINLLNVGISPLELKGSESLSPLVQFPCSKFDCLWRRCRRCRSGGAPRHRRNSSKLLLRVQLTCRHCLVKYQPFLYVVFAQMIPLMFVKSDRCINPLLPLMICCERCSPNSLRPIRG